MNHNIIDEKTNLVCYRLGYNMYKINMYVMSLGIGKTLYQIVMVFNTKAHTKVDTEVDTPVYPYILAQYW